MFKNSKNQFPYIIDNDFPKIKGLEIKQDPYTQTKVLKKVMRHFLAYSSSLLKAMKNHDRKTINDIYEQTMAGKLETNSIYNLTRAGLENSVYPYDLKELVTRVKKASDEEIDRLAETPFFSAIFYGCQDEKWRNWKPTSNAEVVEKSTFTTAVYCQILTNSEGCYFDIFSLMHDSLKGKANLDDAIKAMDMYTEHLKQLPMFLKNCYLCPEKEDEERI